MSPTHLPDVDVVEGVGRARQAPATDGWGHLPDVIVVAAPPRTRPVYSGPAGSPGSARRSGRRAGSGVTAPDSPIGRRGERAAAELARQATRRAAADGLVRPPETPPVANTAAVAPPPVGRIEPVLIDPSEIVEDAPTWWDDQVEGRAEPLAADAVHDIDAPTEAPTEEAPVAAGDDRPPLSDEALLPAHVGVEDALGAAVAPSLTDEPVEAELAEGAAPEVDTDPDADAQAESAIVTCGAAEAPRVDDARATSPDDRTISSEGDQTTADPADEVVPVPAPEPPDSPEAPRPGRDDHETSAGGDTPTSEASGELVAASSPEARDIQGPGRSASDDEAALCDQARPDSADEAAVPTAPPEHGARHTLRATDALATIAPGHSTDRPARSDDTDGSRRAPTPAAAPRAPSSIVPAERSAATATNEDARADTRQGLTGELRILTGAQLADAPAPERPVRGPGPAASRQPPPPSLRSSRSAERARRSTREPSTTRAATPPRPARAPTRETSPPRPPTPTPHRARRQAANAAARRAGAAATILTALIGVAAGVLLKGGTGGDPTALAANRTSPVPTSVALAEIPPDYLALYRRAGQERDLDWRFLAAIGSVESDHGRNRYTNVRNHAGCVGPMQIGTGGACGDFLGAWGVDGDGDGDIDARSPADAIATAARGLREGKGAPGDGGTVIQYYRAACAYYGACSDGTIDYADEVLKIAVRYGFPGS